MLALRERLLQRSKRPCRLGAPAVQAGCCPDAHRGKGPSLHRHGKSVFEPRRCNGGRRAKWRILRRSTAKGEDGMRLRGRWRLLTGAAAAIQGELMGFGGAAAHLFVREGAKVVLTESVMNWASARPLPCLPRGMTRVTCTST